MDRMDVVRVLREIAVLLQVKGENAFKSRAYEIAADRIGGSPEDLERLVRERRLRELPGVGEAIEEKVTELVTTGHLSYYEALRAEYPPGILELLEVPEMGPKKAAALWRELHVGDLDALETACREGRVRALKGFGPKTEAQLLEGVQRARAALLVEVRHRLGDTLPLAEELLQRVQAAPGTVRAAIAGSIRRRRETVSDVDLVVSAANPTAAMDALASHHQVEKILARGETKLSVRLHRPALQVDLRVVPDEDFATALHHFTGSKAHHLRLRGLAKERGLEISEWGVRRSGEKLPVPDEATLYRLLGMQSVPPELREDWGEVEAALSRRLPERLVELADIAGNVHSHSTWSDGRDSLEAMARAAKELGLRYLTVTEHSQAAHYAGGLKADDLRRQSDEIDRLNELLAPFRLLKGIEVDILEEGALDFPESVLERLEVVIGSIHARHHADEAKMTARVLRALDDPHLHILGHATGRLINSRPPYALKMDEVLDKAAQEGVAVEINGNPHRLDLKAEHVRLALARGVKLVASTDSHSVGELQHLGYAVATARRGWATPGDVLNALEADAFVHALATMRR